MITIAHGYSLNDPLQTAMFADRKRVFVDQLGWTIAVTNEGLEIDQFDGDAATYIIDGDEHGCHLGSLRLLPTTAPHILDTLFARLSEEPLPRGPEVCEITRLCIPHPLSPQQRRSIRNRLISAMTDFALARRITALTGVVRWPFLKQILAMGWRATALGRPHTIDGMALGAFRIDLDIDTPDLLAATGIYQPRRMATPIARLAA